MEFVLRFSSCMPTLFRFCFKLRFAIVVFEIVLILAWLEINDAKTQERQFQWGGLEERVEKIASHSCIHDQILEQRKRPGHKVYSVTPQVYEPGQLKSLQHRGRALLDVLSTSSKPQKDEKQPIRIYLNYDAVGHSPDRDCQKVGDIVKLGEPPINAIHGLPSCNPLSNPPIFGDCWYNCTSEDISGEDKKHRLRKALGQTADWFRRALAVEPVKGNLRLSGYSACGQDGGVQLPRGYVEEGVSDADLVLLVTTRPTTGNTLAWAVACERDQWGRAIAGHVNVAPRHLTAEAETLLSATLIHEVIHVLGFDPHAFTHFRDERRRRRNKVTEQVMDEKIGRIVTRVVLPRVVMHSRHHYAAFSGNFTGLELEDGGGRGTSGSHWEKRLLMNEIMTGSVDTRSVVSKMTLALLEDSGWYKANYSMADRLDWGRNQGTEFVTSPCNLWKGAYHCNSTQISGCTYNREAEGYCPILTYSGDLPQWAQYFQQANKGGQSSLADYCTYFVAYSDGSCTDTNSARAPDRMLGEVRGSNSRCMASSLVRTGFVRGSMTQGNGCYQHRCINNTLEVAVDGMWRVCPLAGGSIQFAGFNGALICPAYYELCNTDSVVDSRKCPNACNSNGDCVDGICHCFLGFHGHDCSRRSCPGNCTGNGLCLNNGICECKPGYTGIDCSTAVCDEQCSLHGGVCDNGTCEFRCSDYGKYTCQNSSTLLSTLSVCKNVLGNDISGQHCAPREPSILQQLEEVVVMPNYHRLFPGGARKLFNIFGSTYCDEAAKRLACWISIQKCDGDNRLRVCHSACQSYNLACGVSLDCRDQTLFSKEEGEGQCTIGPDSRDQSHLWHPLSRDKHFPLHFPNLIDFNQLPVIDLGCEFVIGNFPSQSSSLPLNNSLYMEKVVVFDADADTWQIGNGKAKAKANRCSVLLTIHISGKLAVFRCGDERCDERWTIIPEMLTPYDDVCVFNGRPVAVDSTGRAVVVGADLSVELVAEPVFGGDKKFLVESDGELLLVDKYLSCLVSCLRDDGDGEGDGGGVYEIEHGFAECEFCEIGRERAVRFHVFRLDQKEKKWVEVKSLEDRVLFLGEDCAFSASAFDLRIGYGNCVIFRDDVYSDSQSSELGVGVFHLGQFRIAPLSCFPCYSMFFWPPPRKSRESSYSNAVAVKIIGFDIEFRKWKRWIRLEFHRQIETNIIAL